MKFINIPVFIISLAIGIFLVYVGNPRPSVIYVYPTPDNLDQMQYKDRSGTCFGFESHEVTCPTDKQQIREYWKLISIEDNIINQNHWKLLF